jgi:rhomboid protease GluP
MNALSRGSAKYMPTVILIGINVAVYAFTSIAGGNFIETNPELIYKYGQVNYYVLYLGSYWQLFTAMFIHVDIVHIAGNMFFLFIFGLRAEEMFSVPEYFSIYLLSGLGGNALSLLFGPNLVSAGASGAIFGVFGAVVIYMRRAIGQSIIGALMYAFFLFMINSFSPGVNILAHLGGLGVGLLIGYSLAATRRVKITYRYSYSR